MSVKGTSVAARFRRSAEHVEPARDARRGTDAPSLRESIVNHVSFTQGKVPDHATGRDFFMALAMTVRDRLIHRWIATRRAHDDQPAAKRVYYLSLEYLLGRTLGNSLVNIGLYDECYQAMLELGADLEEARDLEDEAGLGNGGLGRLAACFLDSMATLDLPAYGYGIRYDYGMFRQRLCHGEQVEEPDDWLRHGSPWEIVRPEDTLRVQFGGRVERYTDDAGESRRRWVDTGDVLAVPYDIPIPGYRNRTVNTLRLFSARATHEFDLEYFNHGNYPRACEEKARAENLTKVLYPKDDCLQGKELRLKQEYFLVSASLQDVLRRFTSHEREWRLLPNRAAIQLNDTHPTLAIPELMRLLVDREHLPWNEAWDITRHTFAYTNHTVLPEALETWRVSLMRELLPRHLEIVYEINRRFLAEVTARHPGDADRLRRVSLIEEGDAQSVRMAHLAVVGSHSVNGVAEIHTGILKTRVLRDFHDLYPERFNNKTNGITPRRWLKKANAPLAFLIDSAIGDGWVADLEQLRKLIPFAEDPEFRVRWREVKRLNKERLSQALRTRQGLDVDPDALCDCQVKRIHEYKRQILAILHAVTLSRRIREGRDGNAVPRSILLAGKAAPGYAIAKLTIRLATAVGEALARDPVVRDRLRLHFVENYGVSLAEIIVPAAELSEQISTAGMEASGTGNMKLSLNGALTIGTLDGANIEIMEAVGRERFFLFGLTAEQVEARRAAGYDPRRIYEENAELRAALDAIAGDAFSPDHPGLFRPLVDRLLHEGDPFMVLADYTDYVRRQEDVGAAYRDSERWTRMSILNTANMGRFSSDRTIREYARDIWKVDPIRVPS